MKILKHFFKPKWQHHDWAIRMDAIENLNDPSLLLKITRSDTNEFVRKAALRKLNQFSIAPKKITSNRPFATSTQTVSGPTEISQITQDKVELSEILNRIRDQVTLASLALDSPDLLETNEHLQRIKGSWILTEMEKKRKSGFGYQSFFVYQNRHLRRKAAKAIPPTHFPL